MSDPYTSIRAALDNLKVALEECSMESGVFQRFGEGLEIHLEDRIYDAVIRSVTKDAFMSLGKVPFAMRPPAASFFFVDTLIGKKVAV
jgi:hypothetical protein